MKNVIDIFTLVTNEQLSNIVQETKIEEIIRIANIAFLKNMYLASMPREINAIIQCKGYDGIIRYKLVYYGIDNYEYSVFVNDFKNHKKNDNVRMYEYEITYSYLSIAIVTAFAYMAENCRYIKQEHFVTEKGYEKNCSDLVKIMNKKILIIAIFLVMLVSIFSAGCVQADYSPKLVKSYNLVALSDSSVVSGDIHGNIFAVSGELSEYDVYRIIYMVDDKVFKQTKIPTEDTIIYLTEQGEQPKLEVYKVDHAMPKYCTENELMFKWKVSGEFDYCDSYTYYLYKLYVPQGSIKQEFLIDNEV